MQFDVFVWTASVLSIGDQSTYKRMDRAAQGHLSVLGSRGTDVDEDGDRGGGV